MRLSVLAVGAAVALLLAFIAASDVEEDGDSEQPQDAALPLVLDTHEDPTLLTVKDLEVFPEVPRFKADDPDIVRKARLGRPFVVEAAIPESAGPLRLESLPLDSMVAITRYLRELPITPKNSRLYWQEKQMMPLRSFFEGTHRGQFTTPVRPDHQPIYQTKIVIDLSVALRRQRPLERKYMQYFQPHMPVVPGAAAEDSALRIQRHPFTYPMHFDCCDNWCFQARGGGSKRFMLYPPGHELTGGGWEELDRLEFLFNDSVRASGVWRARMTQATLHPGDALFVPMGWYHGVMSYGDEDGSKFCLSYSCGVDYEDDPVYQKEMAECNVGFATSYPRQDSTVKNRDEYAPQPFWGRMLDLFQS